MQLPLRPFPVKRLHIPTARCRVSYSCQAVLGQISFCDQFNMDGSDKVHLGSFPRSLGWSEKFWAAAAQQGDDGYEQQQ